MPGITIKSGTRNFLFFTLLVLIRFNILLGSVSVNEDSSFVFFPEMRIYPVIFLDPLECMTTGGSFVLSSKEEDMSLYSIVNLGFNKPVLSHKGQSVSWDITLGTAVFTQFDLNRRMDGSYLAGILGNDYKISADFNLQKNKNIIKFRFFHLSSHLGDDYILRNTENNKNDKSANYEQVDLTFLRYNRKNYWFAGLGEIYTKYVFRKRFSMQVGGLLNFKESKPINFFTSGNIKVLAENNYVPDFRSALGVNINRKSESLIRLWLEYYNGQLPYGTVDYGRVSWIGLAMAMNLN